MRPWTDRAFAAFALLAVVTSPTVASAATEGAETIVVDMEDFEFRPATIRVPPGANVTFMNRDGQVHTATSVAAGTFDTGNVEPGARARIDAPQAPGAYALYCVHHAAIGESGDYEGMVGTLVVEGETPPGGAMATPGPEAVMTILAAAAGALVSGAAARPRWVRQ